MNKKDIGGYEGLYRIYNDGRICSLYLRRGSSKIKGFMKGSINKAGYRVFSLHKNNKIKQFYLHRLLATHFIPNPYNYSQVNHLDGNKLNNALSNLEWCTPKHNVRHAFKLGLMHPVKIHPWQNKAVVAYKNQSKIIFSSITHASKKLNILKTSISNCLQGRTQTAGGYRWELI